VNWSLAGSFSSVMIAIRLAAVWFFLITPKPAALGTRQCSLTRCDQTKKVRREREPAHGGTSRSALRLAPRPFLSTWTWSNEPVNLIKAWKTWGGF
jgi:hypothetical protein